MNTTLLHKLLLEEFNKIERINAGIRDSSLHLQFQKAQAALSRFRSTGVMSPSDLALVQQQIRILRARKIKINPVLESWITKLSN